LRIDQINDRMDRMAAEINLRIDQINDRMDRMAAEINKRIDQTNDRLNRLYEVIVRREEHQQLEARVIRLEQEVAELKRQQAA
ncbi:MAG: hypothetical protein ACUVRZ_11285, partial [Desulfobacca sp.]